MWEAQEMLAKMCICAFLGWDWWQRFPELHGLDETWACVEFVVMR